MMTVRFPSGFSVQYNDANYASRTQWGYTDIYTKKDGQWVAQVPNDALIEIVKPCETYFAGQRPETAIGGALQAIRQRPTLSWSAARDLAALKRELQSFDALRKSWK